MIVMEGLVMYLSEATNLSNLSQFVAHFGQHGGEMCFDVLGGAIFHGLNAPHFLSRHLRGSDRDFKYAWYLNDPKSLEAAVPGLRECRFDFADLTAHQGEQSSRVWRCVELLLLTPLLWVLRLILLPLTRLPLRNYLGGNVKCKF